MARYPGAIWRPLTGSEGTNWRRGRARRKPNVSLIFVGHSAVSNEKSLFGLFNNPARRASCHIFVDFDGGAEQYVDTDDTAFTNGCNRTNYLTPLAQQLCGSGNSANDNSVTMELAGGTFSAAWGGYSQPMNAKQFFRVVDFLRWFRKTHLNGAKLVLGVNVAEHNWFASTACPSSRYAWHLLLAAANDTQPVPQPQPNKKTPTFAEVRKFWNIDDPAKFGQYTLSKWDGLFYLLRGTALTNSDDAGAWAYTQRLNADFGKPWDPSWDG